MEFSIKMVFCVNTDVQDYIKEAVKDSEVEATTADSLAGTSIPKS